MRKFKKIYLVIIILVALVAYFILTDANIGSFQNPDNPDTDGDSVPDITDTDDDNDGVPDSEEIPEEEDDTGDDTGPTGPTGSWHTSTYTGSNSAGFGDFTTSFFSLTGIPPFTSGDDIQISFTHSWATTGGCDDGMVWCVHDSNGAQVFHEMEYTPATGTDTITGTWDGATPWYVWVGNNCENSISFSYTITVRWYGE